MKTRYDMLKQLATLLGDEHDLVVFRVMLVKNAREFGDDRKLKMLLGLVDQRRVELQAQAKPLGQRLYAEKPKHLVRRLSGYWDVWYLDKETGSGGFGRDAAPGYVKHLPRT
jgi:hypothetical protein